MNIDKQLQEEFDFYLSQPEEWKKENYGKFVLIKDPKIQGIFQNRIPSFGNCQTKWNMVWQEVNKPEFFII